MAKASPNAEVTGSNGWILDRTPAVPRSRIGTLDHRVSESATGGPERRAFSNPGDRLSSMVVFVSTLAHEIRQPLAVMMATIDVVCESQNPEVRMRAAATMRRQVSQMNRVVEDVLEATRWAHGSVTLRKERADVRDIIKDVALDLAAAIAERGHTIVVASGMEPLWADVDLQRVHQMLSNLLHNAIKYTEPGGQIWLLASRQTTGITLLVRDTGRGIAPEALTGIFDLFAQVQPADAIGLGIGLSVVREIVALHGGRIEARSDGLGHGSDFIVTLPLASSS